ncbi:MAG: Rieske (2Fe-2S) protein [Verrucomicrobia bacterium]|nr:Rieske (2Fe-2S) protein [Verrucomicrobiota bacterium]
MLSEKIPNEMASECALPREVTAPPANRFPKYPAAWYLFCHTRELRRGPLTKRMLGRELVAFRAKSGLVAVLEARCAHLAADLGQGRVIGEAIQCPFHHWEYGADGRCTRIPECNEIPHFARLRSYPVEERHGNVFFFNGREPLFPLPFFDAERAEDYVATQSIQYVFGASWYMVSGQAFDTQHFRAVHERKLVGQPTIDCPSSFARRIRYQADIVGRTPRDRLLRLLAGRTVNSSITVWGGLVICVAPDFPRLRSRFLIFGHPLENGQTDYEILVFVRRRRNPVWTWLRPLELSVRRWFTFGFLVHEARKLRGIQYRPGCLIENDRWMADFFRWAVELPQQPQDTENHENDRENDRNSPGVAS